MSDEDMRALQMRIAFRSTDPELTRYPHLICKHSDGVIDQLEHVVTMPIGVWGTYLLADADGHAYVAPKDGRIVDDFKLWKLAANQDFVRRGLFTTGFTMVIPANTPPSLLQKIYSLKNEDDQAYEYDVYITRIAELIGDIGWAYIPLEYEHDYAVFVASFDNRRLVEELRARLVNIGVAPVFNVTATDSGQRWDGPIIWESE
jgi:hypothetical protein